VLEWRGEGFVYRGFWKLKKSMPFEEIVRFRRLTTQRHVKFCFQRVPVSPVKNKTVAWQAWHFEFEISRRLVMELNVPRVGEVLEFVFSEDRVRWVNGTVLRVDEAAASFDAVRLWPERLCTQCALFSVHSG